MKSHLFQIIIVSCFLFCIRCGSKSEFKPQTSSNPYLDIFTPIKQTKDSLSFFANEITFLKLEFTPKCPLTSNVSSVYSTDSSIFIADMYAVYQFDNNGRFIRQVGRNGRGPGEYPQINCMQIDRKQERVSVFPGKTEGKVIQYNFSGDFIKEIKIKNKNFVAFDINNSGYIFHPFCFERFLPDYQMLYQLDSLGNLISSFPSNIFPGIRNETQKVVCYGSTRNWSWKYNNSLFFIEEGNDTIYQIVGDSLHIREKLGGVNKLPNEKFYFSKSESYGNEHIKLVDRSIIPANSCVFESNRFLFFRCEAEKRRYFSIFDKQLGRLYRTHLNNSAPDYDQSDCFFDDLVSGLSFNPVYQMADNQIATFIYPYELTDKKRIVVDFFSENPNDKTKQLIEIITNLNENDNPILVIARMK